jgi:hypothetical protein
VRISFKQPGSRSYQACLSVSDGEPTMNRADLRGTVRLAEANLSKAKFDSTTRWPAHFDPVAAGAEKQDR